MLQCCYNNTSFLHLFSYLTVNIMCIMLTNRCGDIVEIYHEQGTNPLHVCYTFNIPNSLSSRDKNNCCICIFWEASRKIPHDCGKKV